ncbi:leucine-rich repeat-containing protein 24-like isoform X2 [Branchiostoma floridae]|uniref:Leucine-rich repeat-containing protein 24-like isoform X2 n=1 Tax=Branchiostoma floridae TaxID=7739 RepID=A0A9J7K840_BRAFL|nr:leucine-rich repeat-containing protein 24-like isoform X2 [Branchiostoma floridae]
MDRKLRHLLMFLLIILMVPNLQVAGWLWGSSEKADSNCTPSSAQNAGRSCAPPRCDCRALGLTSINVNLPTSFTELDLGHNKITMIQKGTFKNLPQLQILDLSKNQITMIQKGAFENLPQLQILILSSNQIRMIQAGTFVNLPLLQKLYLHNNQITMIQKGAFENLPQLLILHLSNNQITMLQASLLVNLPLLQTLFLHDNQITMIQAGTFVNLPKLQKLTLTSNKMSAITPLAFRLLPCNLNIELNGNPWQCDCKMVPFRLDSTEFPSYKHKITCAEPANLRGQKLTDVSPDDLICAEQTTFSTLPVQVTFNDCYKGTTSGFTVKNKKGKTKPTVASPPQSISIHADARSTSINNHNYTAASSTAGPVGKRAKTRALLSSTVQATSDKPETEISHADTQITSNDYYNCIITDFKGKRGTTGATESPTLQTTSDEPKSGSSIKSYPSFPIPAIIGSIWGSIAGIALIGTVILTIWCKRRTKNPLSGPSSGPNSNIALDNVAKSATLVTSGHDQTGQGQCQTITDDETIYVQPDGALYMKQEDVLYEMPADAGPRQPTEETSLAPSKRKSRLKDKPNSLPPPRGDDDCVYVVPDGAMYMTPEDVLYEMPTNSHHKQPIGTNENMHYYQPQTKDTALPTDADGYMIVAPKHMEGH